MLAHARLAVTAAKSRTDSPTGTPTTTAAGNRRRSDRIPITDHAAPDRTTIIPISLNDIRHLVALIRTDILPAALVIW
ncbi:hypothetical protein I6A81_21190 [Frankia sp. CN7]|uniref:Uncharacterized protein n=1 Tax=Frankia nepalensis TaxID=1836974 RepID=A0A937R9B0_9ACTN|nr:hypothetical protein [Frankia nepalensis]MBL7508424.1 hypothetical protein [Frankia nepalensis]MBL7626255.1 hypothetical protein [Frankia nepalensis]